MSKSSEKKSDRGNVQSGKCPIGELSGRGTFVSGMSGKCPVGEMSGRGIVLSGSCPMGNYPSGNCLSGICPRGSVSRGSVQSGKCPVTVEKYDNRVAARIKYLGEFAFLWYYSGLHTCFILV